MDQREGISNFREIDADGNTVPAEAPGSAAPPAPAFIRRINPFIVILWLLTALLLIGSIQIFGISLNGLGPNVTPGFVEQFGYILFTLAPWCLLASILITTGLLFWHANQWQKRRDGGA